MCIRDRAKGIKSFKKGMAQDPTEDQAKNITENNDQTNNQDPNNKE